MSFLLREAMLLTVVAVLLPMLAYQPLRAALAGILNREGCNGESSSPRALAGSLALLVSLTGVLALLSPIYPELPALPLGGILLVAACLGLLETVKRLPSHFPVANRLLLASLCFLAGFGFHPSETLDGIGWVGSVLIDYPVTLLFYIGVMASMSVLDRLHGLATGATMIMALALMGLVTHWATDASPLLLLSLGGVCLGHLLLVQGDKRLRLGVTGQLLWRSCYHHQQSSPAVGVSR